MPSYGKLQIPTAPQEWPSVPSKLPLRASVNGFGSGGTNCHAIMESYVPEVHDYGPWGRPQALCETQRLSLQDADFTAIPFVFSASSESALVRMLENYAHYLENTDVSVQRLAMTLNSRRSTLPVRIALAGTSKHDMVDAINKQLSKARGSRGTQIGTRPPFIDFDQNRHSRILGVFTGQGAQWPGMGQTLMKSCALFRETIEVMERSLAHLPDPPEWSLKGELMAPPAKSRLYEAELSLPICTAIQVGLVRLLAQAGVIFHTVVGHSGGEIGAAYAVGKISATDAVRIAYYRGIVCKLAIGTDGKRGAMIAVGFGYEEGIAFCSSAEMNSRLTVAASNSPKSVTLSGDKDAVIDAKKMLDNEGLFNRVLKVDTGYHSPHMLPCAQPYTAQLESCQLNVGKDNGTTAWVSSVYEDTRTITSDQDTDLQASYWTDNLIGRVLFSQALERALDDGRGALDLILEIGPHPALRGPTLETMRSKLGYEVPYSGVLDRKADDVTAFSNALSLVWTHLGPSCLNFGDYLSTYDKTVSLLDLSPLPDLPTYPWDHKQILFRESRLNKQTRSRVDRPHELLGSRTPDDTDYEPRWRNFFKLEEMPWLRHHCIQNQIIAPAATYCVMALEAARILGRGKHVESIELLNITILRPIILEESSEGTETLLSLRSDLDSSKGKSDVIRAHFSLSAGTVEAGQMRTAATGDIRVSLARKKSNSATLSSFSLREPQPDLLSVNVNQFYKSLSKVGLDYSGPFKAITFLERRMDMASATVAIDKKVGKSIPVHPTWLDACFQTLLAAFAAPRDGSLWTAFMPTTIGRMIFFSKSSTSSDVPASMTVNASVTEFTPAFQVKLPTISGDMSIHNFRTGQLEVHIEDFTKSSFLPATEKDDRLLYLKTVWHTDILSGASFETERQLISAHELKAVNACEKAITYYLSILRTSKAFHEKAERIPGLCGLVEKAVALDANQLSRSELLSIVKEFREHIDMMLVWTIGEKLLIDSHGLVSDGAQALESLNDPVFKWHDEGLGFAQVHKHMVSAAKQISYHYPSLKILQVGPSSASLIQSMRRELERALKSYTIVDGSAEAIEKTKARLVSDRLRVYFKIVDVESVDVQFDDNFAAGSFDLVIVHKAFRKQTAALRVIQRLLRPGGFLLMMTATGNRLRFPFFLLSAPAPVSEDDGSVQPKLTNATRQEIHGVLQKVGFSGVDAMALDSVPEKHTFSVVVSQALDNQIRFLKAPLASTPPIATSGKILILGGLSPKTATLIRAIQTKLSGVWDGGIFTVNSLRDLNCQKTDKVDAVLSLTELDCPVLERVSVPTYKGLQLLLETSKIILWITLCARSESPYQSGMIGLGRTFQSENPHKTLQFLDLDKVDDSESLIAESLLRLVGGVVMREDGPKGSQLWNIETELAVEKGRLLIPRLLPDKKRNDRLNSLKRKVESHVLVGTQPITLIPSSHDSGEVVYAAEEALHHRSNLAQYSIDSRRITLRVDYCSATPVMPNHHEKQLFCCIGRTQEGMRFLALSFSNSSVITTPRVWTIRLDDPELRDETTLPVFSRLLNEIKLRVIKKYMPSGCVSLLYSPDSDLASALDRRENMSAKDFAFIGYQTQMTLDGISSSAIEIPPHTSMKKLKSLIPHKTRLLVDLGHGSNATELAPIQQVLPKNAAVVPFNDLETNDLVPHEVLFEALGSVKSLSSSIGDISVVKASDLVTEGLKRQTTAAVVDWTGDQTITLAQRPIDPCLLFSPNKTYLLMGLSGQIGQSMCRWMVGNGAQHIVVTSRNPNKQALWKDELQKQGANIAIEAADITEKQDLMDLRTRILGTMPPIGGVANGAMILSDKLFADMTYDSFRKVLRPKVEGSKNLDEVFSEDDLDFFILFSSISAVTGQRSQANYAAANNFMVGLASHRRARNLPASVIDIGMVIGIGVIQRTEGVEGISAMENALRKLDYMPLSERDLHHLLAEAIVVDVGSQGAGQGSKNSVQKSLKEKLVNAHGPEDALQIMEGALLTFLASSLKLSIESIHTDVPMIDLGIDSLVAVEIRNWIFSDAGHDIPVLKILGGFSVKQICSEVVSSLCFECKQTETPEAKAQLTPPANPPEWNAPSSDTISSEALSETSTPVKTSGSSLSLGSLFQQPDSATNERLISPSGPVNAPDVKKSSRPMPLRTESLSLGQSRLYFLSQYLKDDTVLNCTVSYALLGKLDITKLEMSLEAVFQRHETLRTLFYTNEQDGQPVQGILETSAFRLKIMPYSSDTAQVKREFDRIHRYHYNLAAGDTFVATVLSHSAESHTMIFGYHHIIMDGTSWQIFQRDLSKFYNDLSTLSSPNSLPTSYIDFTLTQQRDISKGAYAERLEFFQHEFREPVDPLPLFPFAKVSTRKSLTQYAVRDVVTHVNAEVISALKKTSQASRTTLFHFFLSAFQVLLHRLLDIEKLCIGIVDANRSNQSFSNTIGFFLETIPVLSRVNSEQIFSDILQTTRTKAYAALGRTGVPTEEILRACNIPASTTETPLFQVMFNYRMGASRTFPMQGVELKFLEYADAKNPFDLVVSVDELDNGTAMRTFSLQDYLYDQEGAELLAKTYTHLLDVLSKDAASSIGSISMFPSSLTRQAIALGTGPNMESATLSAATVSRIIGTWVNKDPEALALKDVNGNARSYLQLSDRARAISAALLRAGTPSLSPVCVLLDPGIDTIATILGILRVGAAYVPLDIRSTDERLSDIVEESGSAILLYHEATVGRARKLHRLSRSAQRIKLVTLNAVPQKTAQIVEDVSAPDSLAMILYTSGSTGKPKGIPISNANIRTPILAVSERVSLGREIVLQQSGQGFDAAIYQILIALANGGTIIMGDNRDHPAELAALTVRERVTCSVFIVSEMQSILKYGYEELRRCFSWRIAMIAGESFTTNLLDQLRGLHRHDLRIVNAYGPTEASVCSSMHEVSSSDFYTEDFSIPIGKALANYGTYIVDEECNPVPVGWPGEIAICGPGVASGYLHLPQLTESKFKHQSSFERASGWDRLYLTGDKGRMLSDGSIVMSGRMDGDDQVKVRGMRVQLDDVSRALVQASRGNLVDAATLVRGDDPDVQRLVAYVVFSRTSEIHDKQTYPRQLSQELPLPMYMRPTIIIPLEMLPVTERGKLDRRKLAALPLPKVSFEETNNQLTVQESRLRDIWKGILGEISLSMPIRRSSDFFSVGGNSLLLLPLQSEIRRVFAEDISLSELFQTSTLQLLAARITGNSKLAHIDWEKETELNDKEFVPSRSSNGHKTPSRKTEGISILLTGATGFLGAAILRQLVNLPRVAHVHCAAIRPGPQSEPRPLGVDSSKVVRHSGDLALPNLGMDQVQLDNVFNDIDVIIHNGAEVSHMKNYRSLRGTNFLSTVELARLAVRRKVPIHYISTGGVARLSGATVQSESSLAAFYPPTDGSDGYVASKWASEVFLEKVHRRFQGEIWIHRPSSITGDNVPALDIVHSVLRYSRLMKAVPDLKGSTGAFDFVHVDTVSGKIAGSAVMSADREKTRTSNALVYAHQSGEEIVPIDRLKEYLEGSAIGQFRVLAIQDWVTSAIAKGLNEVVGSFLLASKGVIRAPLLQKSR